MKQPNIAIFPKNRYTCAVYLFIIITMFIAGVPAYYLAKSKGLPAFGVTSFGVVLVLPVHTLLASLLDGYGSMYYLSYAAVATPWLVVQLLPERSGAPGKQYLHITFPCPECDQSITFPRHREGIAVVCPECDEIVTVPTDEFSPGAPAPEKRTAPPKDGGIVVFETFCRETSALQLNAMLNDAGIKAFISSDDAGGLLPHVGMTQGYAIHIDAADWGDAELVYKTLSPTPETA